MQAWWTSLAFLVGAYWPLVLLALAVGLVTGWRSFSAGGARS